MKNVQWMLNWNPNKTRNENMRTDFLLRLPSIFKNNLIGFSKFIVNQVWSISNNTAIKIFINRCLWGDELDFYLTVIMMNTWRKKINIFSDFHLMSFNVQMYQWFGDMCTYNRIPDKFWEYRIFFIFNFMFVIINQ